VLSTVRGASLLAFWLAALTRLAPASAEEQSLAPPASSQVVLDGQFGKLTLGGYGEGYYQWNFNRPPSGITNFRGFDNRHNAFTIANAVVDAQYEKSGVMARIALQVGHTPNTYYLAEPTSKADLTTSVIGASDAATWRFIQQALIGYKIPLGLGLLVQGGIFLSPIGPESMAVRDNWTYSRSNLFFNLPFYHTGVRLTQQLSEAWSATIGVVNGWNSVVDNNGEKSLYGQLYYNRPDRFQASLGGATYVRVRLLSWLLLAARGDALWERKADQAIFFAGTMSWLASGTATLECNWVPGLILRLEYRHDHSDGDAFFAAPGSSALFSGRDVGRNLQDTLTAGAVVWF
jgi:hypothetical protein